MIATPWFAIEGCIGSGKTTLCRVLGDLLNASSVCEESDKHPFIIDFYQEPQKHALQTEIGFVLLHYHQIAKSLEVMDKPLITDFTLDKDMLFASMNLHGDELAVFRGVYDHFYSRVKRPDLLIYLQADDELLWRRIKLRDREYERNMPRDYLKKLNTLYEEFICSLADINILRIRVGEFDVVDCDEDRIMIANMICEKTGMLTRS